MADWAYWLTGVSLAIMGGLGMVGGIVYAYYRTRYLGQVVRIFEEKPLFVIPRGKPMAGAEDVHFETTDGLTLRGCYITAAKPRRGVILFGLEFGSNRWSVSQYCDRLLDAGYDVFAFEPRNQGESDKDATYAPMQWVTDRDLADMRAAVAYLKRRKDADPAGVGVFGVSKGGSLALLIAAEDPWVRCVATDGAFAVYTTMVPYMRRWVSLYSPHKWLQEISPDWCYGLIGMSAVRKSARNRGVRFPSVERAVRKVTQPLLMIHGEADSYIKPAMAEALYRKAASRTKRFWPVPGAKHNQALVTAGEEYGRRLIGFFDEHLGSAVVPESAVLPAPAVPAGRLAAAGAD